MTLLQLLTKNYSKLGTDSQACLEGIIEFLDSSPNLAKKSIIFLKRLTKVASHFIGKESRIDDYLQNLYDINLAGANRLESVCFEHLGNGDVRAFRRYKRMQSHFFSHAGNVSRRLFSKTQEITWMEKSYNCELSSAEGSREIDRIHSAYSYGYAGDFAKAMFAMTEDIDWAVKAYQAYIFSAQISRDFNQIYSAQSYAVAAMLAETIFFLNKKQSDNTWMENAYDARVAAAEATRRKHPGFSAKYFSYAGDTALTLSFLEADQLRWRSNSRNCFENSQNCYRKAHDSKSAESMKRKIQDI